jgi:hypothetical protein
VPRIANPQAAIDQQNELGELMAVPENIKKMWIEIQRKYDFPVNAIGVRINQKDTATLKVWKEEGIDRFQKK